MDLRLSDGHCKAPHNSHYPNGLLGRREKSYSVAFQESQARTDSRHADHSILRQCFAVLGDR